MGWVTEMKDPAKVKQLGKEHKDVASGIDNLLYSPDADFSCFADLALTSPWDYFKEGEGSLMQCVITPPGNGVVSGKDYEPLRTTRSSRWPTDRCATCSLPQGISSSSGATWSRSGRACTGRSRAWTRSGPTRRRPSATSSWRAATRSRTTSTAWRGPRGAGASAPEGARG